MTRRARASSTVVRLDLSNVESRVRVTAGEYPSECTAVTKEKGDKAEYLAWEFKITEGDSKGAPLYINTSLSEASLWNLRGLLEALEVEIPDSAFDLDLKEMVGTECLLIVEPETEGQYKGKPRVVDFAPLDDGGGSDTKKDAGKKEATGSKRSSKKKDLDPLTQDEINDMSQDELEAVNDEYKLDVDLEELKTLRKMKAAIIDALDEAKLLKDE